MSNQCSTSACSVFDSFVVFDLNFAEKYVGFFAQDNASVHRSNLIMDYFIIFGILIIKLADYSHLPDKASSLFMTWKQCRRILQILILNHSLINDPKHFFNNFELGNKLCQVRKGPFQIFQWHICSVSIILERT